MKVVLIGAGNVSHHLGPLLLNKGHKIVQVVGKSLAGTKSLAKALDATFTTKPDKITEDADVYIVALRDEVLSDYLLRINFLPKLIVHTSGSFGLEVFPKKMKQTGVLYPLQTFSRKVNPHPANIPFCIEASNKQTLKSIRKLAETLSKDVVELNTEQRQTVHLAAVFANNFTNHLYTLAEQVLNTQKIDFDILKPILLETALKAVSGNPHDSQTGPAQRGDKLVLARHRKLLKNHPQLKAIYNLLSKSIEENAGRK